MTQEEIKQQVRDEIKTELIKHMIVNEFGYNIYIKPNAWHKIFKTKEVKES